MNNNLYIKNISLLKEFNNICKNNNIFYTLDKKTLHVALEKQEFKIDIPEVLMTDDSYLKLKEVMPNKCLDNTTHMNYFELNPKFVFDKDKFFCKAPYIKINIIIKTRKSKLFKYINFFNYFKLKIAKNKTQLKLCKNKSIFKKIIFSFFSTRFFKFTTYDICDKLSLDKNQEHEGYFIIDDENFNINDSWKINFNKEVRDIYFLNENFNIPIKNEL